MSLRRRPSGDYAWSNGKKRECHRKADEQSSHTVHRVLPLPGHRSTRRTIGRRTMACFVSTLAPDARAQGRPSARSNTTQVPSRGSVRLLAAWGWQDQPGMAGQAVGPHKKLGPRNREGGHEGQWDDRNVEAIVWTAPAWLLFDEQESGTAKGIRTPDLNLERVVS